MAQVVFRHTLHRQPRLRASGCSWTPRPEPWDQGPGVLRFVVDRGLELESVDYLDPAVFTDVRTCPPKTVGWPGRDVFSGTATNDLVVTSSYYSDIFKQIGNTDFPYSLNILSSPNPYRSDSGAIRYPQVET